MKQGVLSAFHFLLVLAFACMGLFFFFLSTQEGARFAFVELLQKKEVLSFLGIGLLFLSLFLLLGFYSLHKKTFYQVTLEKGSFRVEELVLKEFLQHFFHEHAADIPLKLEVFFSYRNKMKVVAYVPSSLAGEFYLILNKQEEFLKQELAAKIGYTKKWGLTVVLI